MSLKLLILFALALALHAEDAAPLATVEQLQKLVAEQKQQLAEAQRQIAQYQNAAQDLSYAFRGCKETVMELSAKQRPLAPASISPNSVSPPAGTGASQAAPTLNPAQQRMMQRGKPPEALAPAPSGEKK